MAYRKGELSKRAIDQGWPHQVALEARFCTGDQYFTLHYFCKDLSLCQRGHAFRREERDYVVFCFAESSHAELFNAKFGGEITDPKDRPRWPR
jgi:hypothetical protein